LGKNQEADTLLGQYPRKSLLSLVCIVDDIQNAAYMPDLGKDVLGFQI
jgi:hypothetical protein